MITELPKLRIGSSELKEALAVMQRWASTVYQVLEQEQRAVSRLAAMAKVTPLEITVSNPPTKQEVEAVVAKVNEIINSIR